MPKKIAKTVVAFKFPADKENDRAFSRYYDMRENMQALAVRWRIPCRRCRRQMLESKISAETEYWVVLVHPKNKIGDLVTWLDEKEIEEVRISLNVPTLLKNANIECVECCNQSKQFGMPQCSQSEAEESYHDGYQSTSTQYLVEKKPLPLSISIKKEIMDIPSSFSTASEKKKVPRSQLPMAHSSPTQINTSQKKTVPPPAKVIPSNLQQNEGFDILTGADFITYIDTTMDQVNNFVSSAPPPNISKQIIITQLKSNEHINATKKPLATKQTHSESDKNCRTMTEKERAILNRTLPFTTQIELDAIKIVSTEKLRTRPVAPPFPKRKRSAEEASPLNKKSRPTQPPFPNKKKTGALRSQK